MIDILMMIVVTEALVELICHARIFDSTRNKIKEINWFFKELLDCPYCLSVWAGLLSAALYSNLDVWPVRIFCIIIAFHRLSNVLHLAYKILLDANLNQILRRTSAAPKNVEKRGETTDFENRLSA
jgi:hypothetical protein